MRYRHITKYKYEVEKQYVHECLELFKYVDDAHTDYLTLKGGVLKIRKGYCWNGASGPVRDSNDTMRASLVHDALYQLMRMGKISQDNKTLVDDMFRDIMLEDGASEFKADLYHYVVMFFGNLFSKRQSRKEPIIIDTTKE